MSEVSIRKVGLRWCLGVSRGVYIGHIEFKHTKTALIFRFEVVFG